MLGLPACASPAMAPPHAGRPPRRPQASTVPPLGFAKRTLANGMEVYTARDTSTSNVTVQVWYRVGSKDDPANRSGFAHLFEHLMFKATKDFPDETFDRLTEDVGGNNNAFTSDDVTAYFETIPANHLERLIFAEASRLGSLVVNEDVFESERDVVKEEYRQGVLASPYGRLFSVFLPQTIYQEHPYRRTTHRFDRGSGRRDHRGRAPVPRHLLPARQCHPDRGRQFRPGAAERLDRPVFRPRSRIRTARCRSTTSRSPSRPARARRPSMRPTCRCPPWCWPGRPSPMSTRTGRP